MHDLQGAKLILFSHLVKQIALKYPKKPYKHVVLHTLGPTLARVQPKNNLKHAQSVVSLKE